MSEEDKKITRLVSGESKRLVTKIFKHSLMILEDLRYQHAASIKELKNLTPQELESLNYLDFTRYSLLRKRILDNGNESIRDLENFLDNFTFKLKNKDTKIVKYTNKRNKEL